MGLIREGNSNNGVVDKANNKYIDACLGEPTGDVAVGLVALTSSFITCLKGDAAMKMDFMEQFIKGFKTCVLLEVAEDAQGDKDDSEKKYVQS